jgi:hypothetical protein
MLPINAEKVTSRILATGTFLTTIFVISSVVTDPVNVTKHFLLGATAFAAITSAGSNGIKIVCTQSKFYVFSVIAFVLFMLNAVINSNSPFAQNLYGTYGRNTGFIAYFSLTLVSLSALMLRRSESFKYLIYGLFGAGFINVFYCAWAWAFGDFIGWSNVYNTILGTFGNPNFIGAFLGIFLSVLFAYIVAPATNLKFRIISIVTIIIGFAEIRHSHAVQGIVVTAAGFSVVGFFIIRGKFNSWVVPFSYSLSIAFLGFISLLGALQIGPLSGYIYKTSVSLRGEYWQAGINMAKKFPLTGVGMDSYGDWYRRLRDDSALVMPGPNTVTNAAHNVNIDVLAYGGWPLFLSYLFMIILTFVSILKLIIRKRQYDGISVSLIVGWVCYQIQAAISINQIGLAIWGWLFSGAIVAYEIATRSTLAHNETKSKIKPKSGNSEIVSPQLLGGLGLLAGCLIAVPPMAADMSWRSALQAQSVEATKASLVPGYLRPMNSYRISMASYLFEQNKIYDLAYQYAKQSTKFNSENFDAWKMLYYATNTPTDEKTTALKNMKRLDPKNIDVLDTPK